MRDERWIRYMRHMRRGEFEPAWQISDSILAERLNIPSDKLLRHVRHLWKGESVDRKRVVVRCYHGLGDTVQLIRYVPMLRAKAAEVTVCAQRTLIPLLKTMHGLGRII